MYLKIEFIEFDLYEQPGYFKGVFFDAFGKKHIISDKIPVIFETLNESNLPKEGFFVPGEIETITGNLAVFNTSNPYGIETEDGETTFWVFLKQLQDRQTLIR